MDDVHLKEAGNIAISDKRQPGKISFTIHDGYWPNKRMAANQRRRLMHEGRPDAHRDETFRKWSMTTRPSDLYVPFTTRFLIIWQGNASELSSQACHP